MLVETTPPAPPSLCCCLARGKMCVRESCLPAPWISTPSSMVRRRQGGEPDRHALISCMHGCCRYPCSFPVRLVTHGAHQARVAALGQKIHASLHGDPDAIVSSPKFATALLEQAGQRGREVCWWLDALHVALCRLTLHARGRLPWRSCSAGLHSTAGCKTISASYGRLLRAPMPYCAALCALWSAQQSPSGCRYL